MKSIPPDESIEPEAHRAERSSAEYEKLHIKSCTFANCIFRPAKENGGAFDGEREPFFHPLEFEGQRCPKKKE